MAFFARSQASPISSAEPAPDVPALNTSESEILAEDASDSKAVSFEEIVQRYHGKVFQMVYRYTGDYEASCDLTQDTFVRAFNAWDEFRGDSQIFTWLYRIAINLCHNHQKKQQRRRQFERVSLDQGFTDAGSETERGEAMQVADDRPLPLEILENFELRARLQEALHALPDNYRTVLVLRDIEGLSYEQIAQITNSTLEAIKSRLFRARNAIRREMEPYLSGPLPGDITVSPGSTRPKLFATNANRRRTQTALSKLVSPKSGFAASQN